ncbi:hypothetical protein L2E82_05395 [Cichorium intybus]|uniref:Uncharacterized protein n=1 Tax=Cichorium intybus TaxID=13427 RepID=A0ACB9H6S6_CICIN|nr:hypothetical protein L2E82_05395 [Cichorium intybus]
MDPGRVLKPGSGYAFSSFKSVENVILLHFRTKNGKLRFSELKEAILGQITPEDSWGNIEFQSLERVNIANETSKRRMIIEFTERDCGVSVAVIGEGM